MNRLLYIINLLKITENANSLEVQVMKVRDYHSKKKKKKPQNQTQTNQYRVCINTND